MLSASCCVISLSLSTALVVFAAQDPAPATPAAPDQPPITDFAWLAGHWRGEGFGGTCEEVWSEPLGGTMMGSFRLVKGGEVVFYELMVLGPDKDGVALKVKHFSKDFVAWEDKKGAVRFAYESIAPNRARFSGLTLDRDGDELKIEVRMRAKDGTTHWEPIALRRAAPGRK